MVEAHGLNPLENPKEVVSQQLLGRSVKEKRAKNIQKEKKEKKIALSLQARWEGVAHRI